MLSVLAPGDQFNCRLVKHALRLTRYKIEDWLRSLDNFNVRALAKNDVQDFVLLKPQTHKLSVHVPSDEQFLRVDVVIHPMVVDSFVVLVGLNHTINHKSDVRQAFHSFLQIA